MRVFFLKTNNISSKIESTEFHNYFTITNFDFTSENTFQSKMTDFARETIETL